MLEATANRLRSNPGEFVIEIVNFSPCVRTTVLMLLRLLSL